jgi:hypothetical protein
MTNDQQPQLEAHPEKNKSIFFKGMVRIMDQQGVLIQEDCLSFFKGNAVLLFIGNALLLIPFEA